MKLTLLGTGSPGPNPLRRGPSSVVELGDELVLIDCGAGALHRLVEAGYARRRIDRILFTHLHSDHITGLPDLLWAGWIGRWFKDGTPTISGPPGTKRFVEKLIEAFEYDIKVRTVPGEGLPKHELFPQLEDTDEGWTAQSGDWRLSTFRVNHEPVDQAFGYRIDQGASSLVFSGDTRVSENLIKHAQDASILVHEVYDQRGLDAAQAAAEGGDPVEVTRLRLVKSYHTGSYEVGKVAADANARHLVLNHLIARGPLHNLADDAQQNYTGKVTVGEDLQVFEL